MRNRSEAGFSYIDVMIALVIMMVGILALLSGISASVVQARAHEQQLQAKQVAASTMESIMSVKETDPDRLGWNAIGNEGTNPDAAGVLQGVFVTGFQPVRLDAGTDQVIGTSDDTGIIVGQLQRQIVITDLCDPDRPSSICTPAGFARIRMRSVAVTVAYFVGGLRLEEQATTILTDY